MSLSRRAFLGRTAAAAAAVAYPGLLKSSPAVAAPAPVEAVPPVVAGNAKVGRLLRGFWVESSSPSPMLASLVGGDGKPVVQVMVPPGGGVQYQFPLGRELVGPLELRSNGTGNFSNFSLDWEE